MKFLIGALALVAILAAAGGYAYYFSKRTIDGMSGPAIGHGNSTEAIDEIPLEIAGLPGYNMRARYVVVKPGGLIRIHSHFGRPAFSYVVNGTVDEYRSDTTGKTAHEAGALTADVNISQWWKNTSNETVRWYVVDIYKTGGNAGE